VESAPGQGSTFTVTLPSIVASHEVRVTSDAVGESRTRSSSPLAPHRSPLVLVIDDDPATRDLLQRTLAGDGFSVVTASTGEEGLRLARELQPALITLDVLMPGIDGWTVLARLKTDPDLAAIPVVVLTILDDREIGFA